MSSRLVRIDAWSAAKLCGVLYFIVGLVFGVLLALVEVLTEPAPGEETYGMVLAVVFPIMYGLIGFIGAPIGCWLYNFVARHVGGLEVKLEASGS